MSIPIPKDPVAVLKQLWIVILPDGRRFQAGASYHLTEQDRDAMVGEVAERLGTDIESERMEPVGDPVTVYTAKEFYEKIKLTTHGLRVR